MSHLSGRRQPALLRRGTVVGVTTMLSLLLAAQAFAWADLREAPAAAQPLPAAPTPAAAGDVVPAPPAAAPVQEPAPAPAPTPAVADAAAVAAGTAHGLACSVLDGQPICTHDHSHTAESSGSTATAPQVPVSCAGDGRTGNRVQAVYVRASNQPDRFDAVLGTLRQQVNVANGVFHRSSGGQRQLRVVTDPKCNPAVERVTLSPAQTRSFDETTKALRALGQTRIDRKYLLFVDNGAGCGLGELHLDDGAGVGNRNNNGNTYAAVYNRCWNGVVIAHELTHVLGGVQPSAPRSTGNYGHCTDQYDVMCYGDGSGRTMTVRCDSLHATLLDCGRDDYFSVAPPAGSYLSRFWNTASNSFLIGGGPAIPVAPSAPTSVGASRTGDQVRVTWGTPDQARSGLTAFDVVDVAASNRVLATVDGAARAATVALTPWRTYRLAVVARNSAGSSAAAGHHEHMVGRAPATPLAVVPLYTASGIDAQVRLTWTATPHATDYVIFRDGRPVATSTTAGWTDPARLALGRQYTYSVQARNAWGTSPASTGVRVVGA